MKSCSSKTRFITICIFSVQMGGWIYGKLIKIVRQDLKNAGHAELGRMFHTHFTGQTGKSSHSFQGRGTEIKNISQLNLYLESFWVHRKLLWKSCTWKLCRLDRLTWKCPHEAECFSPVSIRILPELCSPARWFLSLRKFLRYLILANSPQMCCKLCTSFWSSLKSACMLHETLSQRPAKKNTALGTSKCTQNEEHN